MANERTYGKGRLLRTKSGKPRVQTIRNVPALNTNFQNKDDKPMTFLRRLTSYFHKEFLTTNETKSVSRDEGSVSV